MAKKGFEMSLRSKDVHHGDSAMKKVLRTSLAVAACLTAAVVAYAAVTFDPETGEGFVGKGDVQRVFDWNNKQLQDNADDVQFRASTVEEISWLCRHNTNPMAADQERSITTTTEGLVDETARERNQITGFILNGYDGDPMTETVGPDLHSCGAMRTYVTDSDETEILSSGVQVSINGTDWFTLQ
jgi:hypothetical protein